jgi:hypothetical protein
MIMHPSECDLRRHQRTFHHDKMHHHQMERGAVTGLGRQPAMPIAMSCVRSKAAQMLHRFPPWLKFIC